MRTLVNTGSGWLRARGAALAADPALSAAVLVLWLLLALFVIFPLAMLFARIGQGESGFNLAGVGTILTDSHQIRAFRNSLWRKRPRSMRIIRRTSPPASTRRSRPKPGQRRGW